MTPDDEKVIDLDKMIESVSRLLNDPKPAWIAIPAVTVIVLGDGIRRRDAEIKRLREEAVCLKEQLHRAITQTSGNSEGI